MLRKVMFMVSIAGILLFGTGIANAANGILACDGGYNLNVNKDVENITSFSLSNFNESAKIVIDRAVVYDRDGNVLCDTDTSVGGIGSKPLVGGDVIAPNGGTWFNLAPSNCFGAENVNVDFNMKIYWSSYGVFKNPLYVKAIVRSWNTSTGRKEAESTYECIPIK